MNLRPSPSSAGGFLGVVLSIILFLLYVFFYFLLSAISLALIGFVIYFFVAAAGLVPPIDFIPMIPYI
jgi:hypothetical protein